MCVFVPSIIIRYDAEQRTAVIFFNLDEEVHMHVIVNFSEPGYLAKLLDTENTVLLFEPAADTTKTVPYSGLTKLSIVATVSPDARRYKEFLKNRGTDIYLPWPAKADILAIAAFIRSCVPSKSAEWMEVQCVKKRIDEFGPFSAICSDF